MRFMMMVKIPTTAPEGDWQPSAEDVGAMSRYNEELAKAGVLLALDGLTAPDEGARLEFNASGTPTVTDGPYTEAKEVIGGYWIIQAKSRDEAIEWASRAPFQVGVIEVRRISELSDFPPDVQDAAGELSQQPPHQSVER
jgi:hypothetical protein